MFQTTRSYRGMVTAPHNLAARAGLRVLEDGGNAIESMVASAATIAVVYPHMNGLGGDNFWLIHASGKDVVGIDAATRPLRIFMARFGDDPDDDEDDDEIPMGSDTISTASESG